MAKFGFGFVECGTVTHRRARRPAIRARASSA